MQEALMQIQISYDQVSKDNPDVVAALVAKIRRGKSRDKDTDPSGWTWSYNWGVRVAAVSPREMVSGHLCVKPASAETRADEIMRNVTIWLKVTCRRAWAVMELADETAARALIREAYLDICAKQIEEEQRMAALTPVERQAEIERLVGELRKMGGFVDFRRSHLK
jgi:hypothetical protein